MPDLDPKSNFRFSDWVSGSEYINHDAVFFQEVLVDTENDVFPAKISGPDNWTRFGDAKHMHRILHPNIIVSGPGEVPPARQNLSLKVKNSSDSTFSNASAGNVIELNPLIIGQTVNDKIEKDIMFFNPNFNTAPWYPQEGRNAADKYDFFVTNIDIVGRGSKFFTFSTSSANDTPSRSKKFTRRQYTGWQKGARIPVWNDSESEYPNNHNKRTYASLKKQSSGHPRITLTKADLPKETKDFKVPETFLKVKYLTSDAEEKEITYSLKATITTAPKQEQQVVLIGMSNELERIKTARGRPYTFLKLLERTRAFTSADYMLERMVGIMDGKNLFGIAQANSFDINWEEPPLCIKQISNWRTINENFELDDDYIAFNPIQSMTETDHNAFHEEQAKSFNGLPIPGQFENIYASLFKDSSIHIFHDLGFDKSVFTVLSRSDGLEFQELRIGSEERSNRSKWQSSNSLPQWFQENFNGLMDKFQGIKTKNNPSQDQLPVSSEWGSTTWPSSMPPVTSSTQASQDGELTVQSRARLEHEREGHRNNVIFISPTTDDGVLDFGWRTTTYENPYSSSGSFILSEGNKNYGSQAWGYITDAKTNSKIYRNICTGWLPNASADNETVSLKLRDRVVGYSDMKYDNPTHDARITYGLNINSTRTWNNYYNSWKKNESWTDFGSTNYTQECTVTYPDQFKDIRGTTYTAIPAGEALCEEKFGTKLPSLLFDFYYNKSYGSNQDETLSKNEYFNSRNEPILTAWRPYATMPPYIRTETGDQRYIADQFGEAQQHGHYNDRLGSNGHLDINKGNFDYLDNNGENVTVYWETNFAQAYLPLDTATEALNKAKAQGLSDEDAKLNNNLIDAGLANVHLSHFPAMGDINRQIMCAHTDLALLSLQVKV